MFQSWPEASSEVYYILNFGNVNITGYNLTMNNDFVKGLKTKFGRLGGYIIWLMILLLVVSTVRNIGKVGRIRSEIDKEKAKLVKLKSQNDDLEREIAQAQGPDFIEKEVRNKLGLAKDNEAVVVLPDPETLKKLAPVVSLDQDVLPDPNWKKWEKLFINI